MGACVCRGWVLRVLGVWIFGVWVLGVCVLGVWVLGACVLGIWVLGALGVWVLGVLGSEYLGYVCLQSGCSGSGTSGFSESGCWGSECWGSVCLEFGCSESWGSGYLGSVCLGSCGSGCSGSWSWGCRVYRFLACTSRANGVQGVWGLWRAGHMGSGHCGLWDHQAPGVLPLGHQGSILGLCHSRQLRYRCPWGSPDFPLLLKWGTPSVLPSMRLVGEIARRELRCHISLQPSLRSRLGP